jgi:hypothetical protein
MRLSHHRAMALLIWLCVPALIFSQLSGLAHRIDHVDWKSKYSPSLQSNTKAVVSNFYFGESAQHSCVLFDASSLVESLHDRVALLSAVSNRDALAIFATNKTWFAQAPIYFSSRAPPHL